MNTVKLKEARSHLGELVNAAERGESVVITRRGRDVALLVPAPRRAVKPLPDLSDFRASIKVRGGSLTSELMAMRKEERA